MGADLEVLVEQGLAGGALRLEVLPHLVGPLRPLQHKNIIL